MEEIRAAIPENAVVIAYLDDIYIMVDRADVIATINTARDVLHRVCHIDINLGKLAAWSKTVSDPPAGFVALFGEDAWKSNKPDPERGMKILGAPFGTQAYLQQFFNRSLDAEAQLLNFLPKLPSLQSSWLLLYFCAVLVWRGGEWDFHMHFLRFYHLNRRFMAFVRCLATLYACFSRQSRCHKCRNLGKCTGLLTDLLPF